LINLNTEEAISSLPMQHGGLGRQLQDQLQTKQEQ